MGSLKLVYEGRASGRLAARAVVDRELGQ